MASVCISSCVDDTRVPVRATYVNLYKWPESDAAFVRSVSANGRQNNNISRHGQSGRHQPRVVDSMSCRQMYLRSYTFSRKESMNERTKKCIGRVKERVVYRRSSSSSSSKRKLPLSHDQRGGGGGDNGGGRKGKCVVVRRVKEASCAAFASIFRRLLSCTTKVDVVG